MRKVSWMRASVNETVYGEHCLVRANGANVFVEDGKRYQISITMAAPTSPGKPKQSSENSVEKYENHVNVTVVAHAGTPVARGPRIFDTAVTTPLK
ncbi:hypothetical protein TNCV_1113871 [Trichonephila clavipes]|nr:hypothetical protein TNCV_1113871 [Trichonephila clavipes]